MSSTYSNYEVEVRGGYWDSPELEHKIGILGIYRLDVTLTPQDSGVKSITGKQRVDIVRVKNFLSEYMREKSGLDTEDTYAEVVKSGLSDWGWSFSIDDFLNTEIGNSKKYVRAIEDFLKQDARVKGIGFDTRIGHSSEHWHGFMPYALRELNYIALEDLVYFFRKLDNGACKKIMPENQASA